MDGASGFLFEMSEKQTQVPATAGRLSTPHSLRSGSLRMTVSS